MIDTRFCIAIAQDHDADNGKEPLTGFLVDKRPQVQRLASAYACDSSEHQSPEPRRYSICDLNTISQNLVVHGFSRRPSQASTSSAVLNESDQIKLDHSTAESNSDQSMIGDICWALRNHQRRNSLAIRFLLPRYIADVADKS